MAAELLVQGSTLSIAPEDILRLTVRDIPPPRSFHPEFDQLHFIPRSIGSGDIYVEACLAMFKVGTTIPYINTYSPSPTHHRTLASLNAFGFGGAPWPASC